MQSTSFWTLSPWQNTGYNLIPLGLMPIIRCFPYYWPWVSLAIICVNFRKYYNNISPKFFISVSLFVCLLCIPGYVYDWTLSKKVAIDELQVGGFSISCRNIGTLLGKNTRLSEKHYWLLEQDARESLDNTLKNLQVSCHTTWSCFLSPGDFCSHSAWEQSW